MWVSPNKLTFNILLSNSQLIFLVHILTRLVCSRACGGELQMLLDKDEVPSERQVVRLMRQILDGLVYLHDRCIAHLDIKVRNLFKLTVFQQFKGFFLRSYENNRRISQVRRVLNLELFPSCQRFVILLLSPMN